MPHISEQPCEADIIIIIPMIQIKKPKCERLSKLLKVIKFISRGTEEPGFKPMVFDFRAQTLNFYV